MIQETNVIALRRIKAWFVSARCPPFVAIDPQARARPQKFEQILF